MKFIRNFFIIFLMFISSYVYAVEEIDSTIDKACPLKKVLPERKGFSKKSLATPVLMVKEDDKVYNDHVSYPCEGCCSSCWSWATFIWNELFCCKGKNPSTLLGLSKDITLHIASFLKSYETLRLSGACKVLRLTFNENYWLRYSFKTLDAYSFLVLKGPLSPTKDRKAFFSHLWYQEGYIELSAKLEHPEAMILYEYGRYGAKIGRNQYVCPLNIIRDKSQKEDHEKTEILNQAMIRRFEEESRKMDALQFQQVNTVPWNSVSIMAVSYTHLPPFLASRT